MKKKAGRSPRFPAFALLALLYGVPATGSAQEPQPVKLEARLNEQVVMLKAGSVELETTIFKPDGAGPFPVAVINHGKASGDPYFQGRARYLTAAREFVHRGYLVVTPMRQGFSKSGGVYISPGCNITSNGLMQAEDIRNVLDTLTKRPDVDPQRIVVIGQSHGGLTTMAFGTLNYPGVRGLINFAGGLKMDGRSCQWDLSLIGAFRSYGAKMAVPSLWFYGDNDSYWGPTADIPARMLNAYNEAGGKARMIAFGRFEDGDAHGMFSRSSGRKVWVQPVEEFLRGIGMPAEIVNKK